MNRRFIVALAGVIVVGLVVGSGASAMQARRSGSSGNKASTPSQQAQTGTSTEGQTQGAAGSQFAGQRGGVGTVEGVTSAGFVLVAQNNRQQVTTNGETKVSKMADAKAADLKVGDSIVATGEQQADGVLAASSIQVGGADGMAGALSGIMGQFAQGGQRSQNQGSGSGAQPEGSGSGSQQRGTAPSGSLPGARGSQGSAGTAVSGAIEAIDKGTITVKTQSGSTSKVTVQDSTTVRKTVQGTLSDIQAGQSAVVTGERKDDGTIVAASVQLIPAGAMSTGR